MGLLHCIMSIVDIRRQIHDGVSKYRINRSAGVIELGVNFRPTMVYER